MPKGVFCQVSSLYVKFVVFCFVFISVHPHASSRARGHPARPSHFLSGGGDDGGGLDGLGNGGDLLLSLGDSINLLLGLGDSDLGLSLLGSLSLGNGRDLLSLLSGLLRLLALQLWISTIQLFSIRRGFIDIP